MRQTSLYSCRQNLSNHFAGADSLMSERLRVARENLHSVGRANSTERSRNSLLTESLRIYIHVDVFESLCLIEQNIHKKQI